MASQAPPDFSSAHPSASALQAQPAIRAGARVLQCPSLRKAASVCSKPRTHTGGPQPQGPSPPSGGGALASREQLKAEPSPSDPTKSTGRQGPGRPSAPRRGLRHQGTRTRGRKELDVQAALGLCWADGWVARRWLGAQKGTSGGGHLSHTARPSGRRATSLPLSLPSPPFPRSQGASPVATSPLLPGVPVARAPQARGSPSLGAGSGRPARVNALCYPAFNPQMGQRLTLFGSAREKALTIICF